MPEYDKFSRPIYPFSDKPVDLENPFRCLSSAEHELLPSAEDVAHYQTHGWYRSKRLLTDGEMDKFNIAANDHWSGRRDRELPTRPDRLADWVEGDGDIQRNNDYIHFTSWAFRRLLHKPVIAATAALLARTTAIRIFQATLIYKPPISGEPSNIVPWHYDKYYWSTCSSDNMLTAFIPLHDCREEHGPLTVIDGSHKWQQRHGSQRPRSVPEDYAREALLAHDATANNTTPQHIPLITPKGHMTFHHCNLYHGSGANVSGEPRKAISLHLQDSANRYRPYAHSNARLEPYKHDCLVGRSADSAPDYSDPDFCPQIWPPVRANLQSRHAGSR